MDLFYQVGTICDKTALLSIFCTSLKTM